MKEHIYRFDNAKVILMIFVIIAHTLINSYGSTLHETLRFICLFYTMPLFTFISGFLSKRDTSFKNNVINLLVPCLIFSVLNDFIEYMVNPNFRLRFVFPGFAMWYIWVLFVYRVTLDSILSKIRKKNLLLISIVAAVFCGFLPMIGKEFSMSRMICFYPFFLLGYYLSNDDGRMSNYLKICVLAKKSFCGGVMLFILYLLWIAFIIKFPGYTYDTAFIRCFANTYSFIIRILLQLSIVVAAGSFLLIVPNTQKWYSKYGSRTMAVYLFHGCIVLPLAYKVFIPISEASLIGKVVMITIPLSLSILLFAKQPTEWVKRICRFTTRIIK